MRFGVPDQAQKRAPGTSLPHVRDAASWARYTYSNRQAQRGSPRTSTMAHLDARTILFLALGATTVAYVAMLAAGLRRAPQRTESTDAEPRAWALLTTGFV